MAICVAQERAKFLATASHSEVKAYVTYADVPPGDERLIFRLADWTGFDRRKVEVMIQSVQAMPSPPTLEEHGFARVPFAPTVGDPDEMARVWPGRVRERLKELTGATEVAVWGYNARFTGWEAAGAFPTAAPAKTVHIDFCPTEFTIQIGNSLAAEALRDTGYTGRPSSWRCFNVWQALTPAPHDAPLALCDARSVAPDDVIRARGQLYDAAGQPTDGANFCLVRPNPAHRWVYFPDLRTDEALVFNGLCPEFGAPWQVVPHTAFEDPLGTEPRSSLEIRAIAVYD